jgi:hypothetical protein
VASQKDTIVGCHHSQELARDYPCPSKRILYINKSHNEVRETATVATILCWLQQVGRESSRQKVSLSGLMRASRLYASYSGEASYKLSLSGMRTEGT